MAFPNPRSIPPVANHLQQYQQSLRRQSQWKNLPRKSRQKSPQTAPYPPGHHENVYQYDQNGEPAPESGCDWRHLRAPLACVELIRCIFIVVVLQSRVRNKPLVLEKFHTGRIEREDLVSALGNSPEHRRQHHPHHHGRKSCP